MFRSFRIGTIFGFPIDVNVSFLVLVAVAALFWGGLAGVVVLLVAFASVLLHELGHALVARQLGVRTAGIELHFFGGAAKLLGQPKSAGDEITIAAAGPAVSFSLAGVALLLHALTGLGGFELLGWINLVIGGFNLIPALPMDGGRILRALLERQRGYAAATELAVKVSRGFALALGAVALISLQLHVALLAVVLWMMGSAELAMSRHGRAGYAGAPDAAPEVEVFPPGFAPAARTVRRVGPFAFHRPVARGGFVVRRVGNRLVIEPRR